MNRRVEFNGRVFHVAFKSSYRGVADYEISLRAESLGRVSVVQRDPNTSPAECEITMEHDADKATRFLRETGVPWADVIAAVRQGLRVQFDEEVREIVTRGWLDGADPCITTRARELGLLT